MENECVQFSLSKQMVERLKPIAEAQGHTVSGFIHELILVAVKKGESSNRQYK